MIRKNLDPKDHPFPNEEFMLIMDLNKSGQIPREQIHILSNLIHKYLNLREKIFYE